MAYLIDVASRLLRQLELIRSLIVESSLTESLRELTLSRLLRELLLRKLALRKLALLYRPFCSPTTALSRIA